MRESVRMPQRPRFSAIMFPWIPNVNHTDANMQTVCACVSILSHLLMVFVYEFADNFSCKTFFFSVVAAAAAALMLFSSLSKI